jgi:hypothetical protein
MICFRTKHLNLGKFWRALEWKMLVHFMVIWNILWSFGIYIYIYIYGLGYVVVIWYIFPRFGILCQEKSGNPGLSKINRSFFLNPIRFALLSNSF